MEITVAMAEFHNFFGSAHAAALAIGHHSAELSAVCIGSVIAFVIAKRYISQAAQVLLQRNVFGIDINKTTAEQRSELADRRRTGRLSDKELKKHAVPESLGIVVGAVYLSVVMILILVLGVDISELSGPLMTITVMLLLGFVDDVLDVRWRHKIFLSAMGSLPLIMTYDGSLSVLVPPALLRLVGYNAGGAAATGALHTGGFSLAQWMRDRAVLSEGGGYLVLYLGPLYLVYLSMLCIFCTNSINILAGVNGVEVGQSIVIAIACVVYNLLQLRLELVLDKDYQQNSPGLSANHQIRALLLLCPFIGVSAALWLFNKYPAKVFVGDSYTYFAGTVLAVAGVTGVYSKTLLLFFAPQLINFVISLPQLFNIVHCPRHRVPTWDPKRNVLCNSHNYTLLNLILFFTGDLPERDLTLCVLAFQAITCVMGFFIRYLLASWMYEIVQ